MKFYRLSGATFYDWINTIYQLIKPFLINKMFLRNMEPLRGLATLNKCIAKFYKRGKFCDFLFSFMHAKPLLKRDYYLYANSLLKKGLIIKEIICCQGKQILYFYNRPLFRREVKTVFTEFPSHNALPRRPLPPPQPHESVSIQLKLNTHTFLSHPPSLFHSVSVCLFVCLTVSVVMFICLSVCLSLSLSPLSLNLSQSLALSHCWNQSDRYDKFNRLDSGNVVLVD